jgi:hypothetical protein
MTKIKIEKTEDLLDLMEKKKYLYGYRETAIVQRWGNYWMVVNRAKNPKKPHAQYRWFLDNHGVRICSVGAKLGMKRDDWYNSDLTNKYYIQKSREDFKLIRNFLVSIDPEADIKVY